MNGHMHGFVLIGSPVIDAVAELGGKIEKWED